MSKLVDTSVIIDYLRRRNQAITFIDALPSRPTVSVASIMELYVGARSRREEVAIEDLLAGSDILPVTLEIARSAGQLMKHFGRAHGLDDLDAIIAATAEHHGLDLATLNVKHFPMFPRLKPAY